MKEESTQIVAAYIPVEGEIKIGDKCLPIKVGKIISTYLGGDLFLNDIGEEVNLPNWKERFDFQKVELWAITLDRNFGRISPFATWVRAGDIIEVREAWWKPSNSSWTIPPRDPNNTNKIKYYQVKCSCCGTYK